MQEEKNERRKYNFKSVCSFLYSYKKSQIFDWINHLKKFNVKVFLSIKLLETFSWLSKPSKTSTCQLCLPQNKTFIDNFQIRREAFNLHSFAFPFKLWTWIMYFLWPFQKNVRNYIQHSLLVLKKSNFLAGLQGEMHKYKYNWISFSLSLIETQIEPLISAFFFKNVNL